jgi:hypothetical protein
MLILRGAALFTFGLALFAAGVSVWLLGLALRVAIRLFQLVLLIIWAGFAFANWLQQRRKVDVLEGEILEGEILEGEILPERRPLPPKQRALPRLTKLSLFVGVMVLAAAVAHADDWRQRAKAAAATHTEPKQCPLYIALHDQVLAIRIPVCFDAKGNVIMRYDEIEMAIPSRKEDACHPVLEAVERVDPSTYLVCTLCKGYKPERATLVFQLIDDGDGGVLRITNAENS